MSVLVIAEHDNAQLKPASLATITAASKIGSPIQVLVAGFQCEPVVENLLSISGIEEILVANNEIYQHPLAETFAPLIKDCVDKATHVFAPASSFGKNIMPRVAALLDVGQVSDVIEVIDSKTYRRPIYAGNAIATVQSEDPIQVLTVRVTAFEPAESGTHSARVKTIDFNVNNILSKFIEVSHNSVERPELSAAEIVISGGRGLEDEDSFAQLTAIADRLGAAIGASRAAVDAGLAPNDYQVGQTGQVVAPKLYIAVGISGAIQHLAGMKDSQVIVAINKDPDAPIFQIADYGLVGDIKELLPQWDAALSKMGY